MAMAGLAVVREFPRSGFVLVSGYTLVALMYEVAASFYIWVPLFVLLFKSGHSDALRIK